MKTPKSRPHSRLLFVGIVFALGTLRALAAGTPAGTSIANQATIIYSVGGISQANINSNSLAFVVDRKINLTVATTDGAAVAVTPGSSDNVLTFTVQNTGNGVQDFAVSAVAQAGGAAKFTGTDNVNATSTAVRVESGAHAGYQPAEDTATFLDEIAANGTATVYIVGNFGTSFANADIATYHLLAEARVGGSAGGSVGAALTETAGADTAGVEDIVFADAQGTAPAGDSSRDAKYSGNSDFQVAAAALTVTKSSVVYSDPINNTTNPKAIPGAIIEYTITIVNGGGAQTATSVGVADDLTTEVDGGTLVFDANGYAAGKGIKVQAPNLYSGVATNLTNAGDADEGDYNVSIAKTVSVLGITLAAGETATVKFRVTIQ